MLSRMLRLVLASVVLCLVPAVLTVVQAAPVSFDILGIKPGMSVAEVKTAMTAHDPKMKVSEVSFAASPLGFPAGGVAIVQGCGAGPANLPFDCAEKIEAHFGRTGKVAYFVRRQVSTQEKLSFEKVIESIVGKYGRPFLHQSQNPLGFAGVWAWDDKDQKVVRVSRCEPGEHASSRPDCGITAGVSATTTQFSLEVTDHRIKLKEALVQEAARKAIRKAKEDKLNAAGAPKM